MKIKIEYEYLPRGPYNSPQRKPSWPKIEINILTRMHPIYHSMVFSEDIEHTLVFYKFATLGALTAIDKRPEESHRPKTAF
jgi:hypothetical protein